MTPSQYEQMALRTEANQGAIRDRRINTLLLVPGRDGIRDVNASRLQNGVTGLSDEVGELNGIIKRWVEYGKPLASLEVVDECGDVLWRTAQILAAVGSSLEEAMQGNIRKLAARYPDGFSDFLAQEENRDREAERKAIEHG